MPLWVAAGSPAAGRVFLNRLGEPYADHREHHLPGGSPIRKAHETACRRAGIHSFRVHDWRHHWACHCVMDGINLETLRLEGGWASLRMVERYATVSAAHRAMRNAQARDGAVDGQRTAMRAKNNGKTMRWPRGSRR